MADVCQDDFGIIRPDRYFPDTFRSGTCVVCGTDTFVARVTFAEAKALYESFYGGTLIKVDGRIFDPESKQAEQAAAQMATDYNNPLAWDFDPKSAQKAGY